MLLTTTKSYAEDDTIAVDVGLGIFHSAEGGLSETKMASLGIQETLWGALKDRATLGGFVDNGGNGKSSSAFGAGQLGFEVIAPSGTVASIFSGPALISSPDTLLGGYFEFMEDVRLGIVDRKDNYVGVFYRHISDAGLTQVNIGRDIIGLEIRF